VNQSPFKKFFLRRLRLIFWKKVNKHIIYLKENGRQITDHWWYKYLTVNFVIAVKECGKAVRLLETMLGGKVDTLLSDSLADLEALFAHHKPNHANMIAVSRGSHNILYGNFVRFQNQWNPFEKKFSNLHNYMCDVAKSFWKDETYVPMLKATFMVSHIISHLPRVPQVSHTNCDDHVCNNAKNKPYVAFALACPKGCMLLVWTKEKYVVNGNEYFCHFYIYIPCGSIWFLPGDMVHAGGFSLGKSQEKNTAISTSISIYVMEMTMTMY